MLQRVSIAVMGTLANAACRWPWTLVLGLAFVIACERNRDVMPPANRVAVLNALRDEINAKFGQMNGTPRINCGPCARFAIAFRERWNARFGETLNLVCLMLPDGQECGHVVLKFPDGSYFDGGNGVMAEGQLQRLYPNLRMEEMVEFDRQLLAERVGGLDHDHYPDCPKYSEELTMKLIEKHLARLE